VSLGDLRALARTGMRTPPVSCVAATRQSSALVATAIGVALAAE